MRIAGRQGRFPIPGLAFRRSRIFPKSGRRIKIIAIAMVEPAIGLAGETVRSPSDMTSDRCISSNADTLSRQNKPSISRFALKPMTSAAGLLGRPGIVMISPQIATTKPAPADSRTSRIGMLCPVGAPRRLGSVVKLY